MKRFYSLFVTCDQLMSSPYIHQFGNTHDITLRRGEETIVNFLLQYHVPNNRHKEIEVIYEPDQLQLKYIGIEAFKYQTLITVKMVPAEVGSLRIGFSFPLSHEAYEDAKTASSLNEHISEIKIESR